MIKIFTDKDFLNEKYRKRIFPILLDLFFLKNKNLLKYYSLVDDMDGADVVIVPIDVSFMFKKKKENYLDSLIQRAKEKNKTIWAYSGGDIGKSIKYDVNVFRLGGFDSKLNDKTFTFPSFVLDPYGRFLHHDFLPLKKNNTPHIGFVGHASGSMKGLLTEFSVFLYLIYERFSKNLYFDKQSFYPSGYLRYKMLKKIEQDNRVVSNFIFREKHTSGSLEKGKIKKSTEEFYQNMYDNPYVFCLRGLGNFSVRFYETLIMGRIPVVIESDMRLPFQDTINWKQHCVFVNEKTITSQLLDFHNTISEEDFKAMQIKNRELALSKLSREGYFMELYNYFKN